MSRKGFLTVNRQSFILFSVESNLINLGIDIKCNLKDMNGKIKWTIMKQNENYADDIMHKKDKIG